MTNDEFQILILKQLKGLKEDFGDFKQDIIEVKSRLSNVEVRQDEMYQVLRAIEHSNQVGKSELDSQNIRLSKVEGKLKKVAKAYIEDVEIEKASNL